MKDIYHIAQTPSGVVVHGPLDEALEALSREIMAKRATSPSEAWSIALGDVVGRIRASLDFPDGFAGTPDSQWSSHVAPGRPHDSLMTRAELRTGLPE